MKAEKKREFGQILLVQESVLIWILTLSFIVLAFYCVKKGYTGSLPWLGITLTGAWAAYGVSQAKYYDKSKAQLTKGGIQFETALLEAKKSFTENTDVDC